MRLSSFDGDKSENGIIKGQDKTFLEDLHNSIWPSTDIDRFVSLLHHGGPECVNARQGARHETCLHRFVRFLTLFLKYHFVRPSKRKFTSQLRILF